MAGRFSVVLPLLALTASLQLVPASAFAPTAAPGVLFASRGANVCAGSSKHAIPGTCGAALLRANPLQRLGGYRCERDPEDDPISRCRVRCRRASALGCTGGCADLRFDRARSLEAGLAPERCGGMGLRVRAPCSPASSRRLARCDCSAQTSLPSGWSLPGRWSGRGDLKRNFVGLGWRLKLACSQAKGGGPGGKSSELDRQAL